MIKSKSILVNIIEAFTNNQKSDEPPRLVYRSTDFKKSAQAQGRLSIDYPEFSFCIHSTQISECPNCGAFFHDHDSEYGPIEECLFLDDTSMLQSDDNEHNLTAKELI